MSDIPYEVEVKERIVTDPAKTSAEQVIEDAFAESALKDQQAQRKKKLFKRSLLAGFLLFFAYAIYWLFAPYQGSPIFGACRTFLELNSRYPHTLRLSTVEEFETSIRIWFTQVDSFGEYKMEAIECFLKAGENGGAIFDRVTINRREVDPVLVNNFNKTLYLFATYTPDLTVPTPLPDSLKDLQFQTDLFRKPIL